MSKAKPPVPAKLDQSAMHLLYRAHQCADEVYGKTVSSAALTPRQHIVLNAIANNPGVSQAVLGAETGIDRSTLADIARRLQRKKLLRRKRSRSDSRAYAVNLTDAGYDVLKIAGPFVSRADEEVLSILGPKRRAHFLQNLELIIAALQPVQSDGARRPK